LRGNFFSGFSSLIGFVAGGEGYLPDSLDVRVPIKLQTGAIAMCHSFGPKKLSDAVSALGTW